MELDMLQLAGLVLGSTFLGALVSEAAAYFRQKRDVALQLRVRKEDRDHQQRIRIEETHAKARDDYIPIAAGAAEWIRYTFGVAHGLEMADWYPENEPKPERVSSPAQAIGSLRRIAFEHPTAENRELAASLATGIGGHYNDVGWSTHGLDQRPTPSLELFQRWDGLAGELISALHQPPPWDGLSERSAH